MVQRKVTTKLGIQADHDKPEKLSVNLRPSSPNHQDIKNRGTDLKKKMKKSGSIKRPDFDILRSSNLKKQPGKPMPAVTTPQKQLLAGTTITTPNYMKSTTSSSARKEKTPVSSKNPQTSSISCRKSLDSSNFNKEMKILARTTSLKMTSTPSFKPVRAKKCTQVVLCENLDAKRATCSSTIKDSKFPTYLTLNPGGTESEGISVMKVCPYTYCSLNGHHHATLPPLKSFLATRRRMVKAQRSLKIACLSPKPIKTPKFDVPTIGPKDQEDPSEVFVQIYVSEKEGVIQLVDEENKEVKIAEEYSPASLVQEEIKLDFSSGEVCELDSDVEREMGFRSALYLDDDYEYPSKLEKEADLDEGKVGNCVLEAEFRDEVSQEFFDEESLSSDAWSSSNNYESDDEKTPATIFNPMEESELARENIHNLLSKEEISSNNITDDYQKNEEIEVKEATDLLRDLAGETVISKTSNPVGSEKEDQSNPETEDDYLKRVPITNKKPIQDLEELGTFNPREPNFLPLEPDPEAENIDLKHQEQDERKNAEEWMVDFALRQVVTKLGPARKKKVSLLVEAFEKVMPINKYESHVKHSSRFDHVRPIQACR